MLTRRSFSSGAACCICPTSVYAQRAQPRRTCFFDAADVAGGKLDGFKALNFKEPLIEGFENGLAIILGEMANLFNVSAAFGFYDDSKEFPNAGADPGLKMPLPSGGVAADGTVAIGRNLIDEIKTLPVNFSAALTAICAHEYGHIIQGKCIFPDKTRMRVLNDLNLRYEPAIELHADFVCGYFAFFRRKEEPGYPAVIQAQTQSLKGDKGQVVSHGTPDQRGNAVNSGYLLAKLKGALSQDEIAVAGLKYVASDEAWK